ncbi:hypothetical protein H4582DRAFT_2125169, partial [Lactarius indigo]
AHHIPLSDFNGFLACPPFPFVYVAAHSLLSTLLTRLIATTCACIRGLIATTYPCIREVGFVGKTV